ncbi:MAG: hypothetical protein WEB57_00500 [Pseudohongiellaceae bacterium]
MSHRPTSCPEHELHSLQHRIGEGVAHRGDDVVLSVMGYRRPDDRNRRRLRAVISDPDLGLGSSHFDFRFSGFEFATRLFRVLALDDLLPQLQAIRQRIDEDNAAFKPYLFVDTGFRRKSQPVFVLAAMEHYRYLHFEKAFWRLPTNQQLRCASDRVRDHFAESGGELSIWGVVQRYWFFYQPGRALQLLPNGQLVSDEAYRIPSRATFPGMPLVVRGALQEES